MTSTTSLTHRMPEAIRDNDLREALYLVWSPDGAGEPRVVHETYHKAMLAAKTMAKRHRGRTFYVVKTCSKPMIRHAVSANDDAPRVECSGKVQHAQRDDAERHIANMRRLGNISVVAGRRNMHSYECPNCGHWHVGSDPL